MIQKKKCHSNLDCFGSTPYCVLDGPNEGKCVACLTDSNCPGSAPICDSSLNICRPCQTDNDCGKHSSVECKNGKCHAKYV